MTMERLFLEPGSSQGNILNIIKTLHVVISPLSKQSNRGASERQKKYIKEGEKKREANKLEEKNQQQQRCVVYSRLMLRI